MFNFKKTADSAALVATDATVPTLSAAPAAALPPEEAQKRAALSKRLEATLGQFVVLMMQSLHFKHHTFSDLEWLVAPAISLGQFAVAEAQSKVNGFTAPVAAITWAQVSDETDAKLAANLDRPFRLRPDEWKSGANIWVIDTFGEAKVIASMLQRMTENEWKCRHAKLRMLGIDGKPEVKIVSEATIAA
ncbi:MAG: toxin-activating lysine-acyltransferase [Hyphomicrobium sp.]